VYDANEAATFTGYGTAQLCVQCHHARRSVSNVEDQIENGSAHFGPHESPQMDEYVGSGCYEIEGYTYERTHAHQSILEACVTCHMTEVSHGEFQPEVAGHTFDPSVTACQGCHPGLTNFDYNNFQTEVEDLLDQLITAIGVPEDSLGSVTAATPDQRRAGYAYAFVSNDASHGVHNPTYTLSLLENAIDFANSLDKGTKPTAMARR